ncbi:cupin domain-containing protein [Streptomyces coeruleorubidus]|uniref:cupin domain-containing protein n=1 Tax=Streptomyces coeruleorubidus TaxID=116188 RepID=UPI003794A81B
MSISNLAQREAQQQLEWIGGSVFSFLLDAEATGGQLTVGGFDVSKGEAPPFHVHDNEDEVFLLSGSALVGAGEEEHELREGGIVFLPRRIPHGCRIASEGFEIPAQLLAEAAELSGNVVLSPPR